MPPITLTRAQYGKTAAAKKKGAGYDKYLAHLARYRPQRMAAKADPLAPLNESQIRSRASQDIRAQVDPIVAEIRRSLGAQTKAGMGAIGGYTNQLATQLGGYADKARDIYGQAQQSQAGSDNALAQMLTGQGQSLAGGLAEKLGAAGLGQPVIDKTTGQVQQTGQGASTALYGSGSASLSNLISQSASAQDYAAKLPGIARLGGQQSARELQLSSGKELSDRIGEVTSQVPGQVAATIAKYRGDELDKTFAREANRTKVQEAAYGAQTAAEKARVQGAVAADRSAQAWAKIQQAGDRLKISAGNASFNQAAKTAGLQLDQKQYKLALAKEQRLKAGANKKGAPGYSPAQKKDWAETAFATASDDFDSGAKPVETLRDLVAAGVPFSIAVRAIQRFGKSQGADNYWKATLGWTK